MTLRALWGIVILEETASAENRRQTQTAQNRSVLQ